MCKVRVREKQKGRISNFHTGWNIMNGISLSITQTYYFVHYSLFGFILAGAGICKRLLLKKKKLSYRKCLSRSHINNENIWKWTRKPINRITAKISHIPKWELNGNMNTEWTGMKFQMCCSISIDENVNKQKRKK